MRHTALMEFRSWRDDLQDDQVQLVAACLLAAANGPFFPESEFRTVLGFERAEIKAFARTWPASDDEHEEFLAINSSINNLLGYPHRKNDEWSKWIPVARDELDAFFNKTREASGANDATRLRLESELAHFTTLTDEQLATKRRHLDDVVRSARRLGMTIPPGL